MWSHAAKRTPYDRLRLSLTSVNPATRIPTAAQLVIDHMNGDDITASHQFRKGNITIRKGIVAIWINRRVCPFMNFGIHVNPAQSQGPSYLDLCRPNGKLRYQASPPFNCPPSF